MTVGCVEGTSRDDCEAKIASKAADLVTLDGGSVFDAGEQKKFPPARRDGVRAAIHSHSPVLLAFTTIGNLRNNKIKFNSEAQRTKTIETNSKESENDLHNLHFPLLMSCGSRYQVEF